MTRTFRIIAASALVGIAAVACGGAAPPPPATGVPDGTQRHCALPAAGQDFTAVNPADVGMDPKVVASVVSKMAGQFSQTIRIYRHGCLVGQSLNDAQGSNNTRSEYFSMTKSVVSLIVGRAITLGYLSLDDTVAKFFPQADEAHGKITVRQLLTDTSGLHFDWIGDVLAGGGDEIAQVLGLPVEAAPGTKWAYAQTTITLLASMTQLAVKEDFQKFAEDELFDKIGISRSDWNWERDAAGHTHGWSWLQASGNFAARLGHLTMNDGVWNGERLISQDYMTGMKTGTAAEPAYGFLLRLNGTAYYHDSATGNYVGHSWDPDAPADLIEFSGAMGQKVSMIPSLDLEVVRLGFQADYEWERAMYRELLPAVAPSK